MTPEPFATWRRMIKEHGLIKTVFLRVDDTVTRITTGLNINDIRSVLRGDPPGKPNPRVKPHTESAIFHICPSFYHEAVTKFYPTLRLGMIATLLFMVETLTGLFVMIYYTGLLHTALRLLHLAGSSPPVPHIEQEIHPDIPGAARTPG